MSRKIKLVDDVAMEKFLEHARMGGLLKFSALFIGLHIARVPYLRRLPVFHFIANLAQNLHTAYSVENEHGLIGVEKSVAGFFEKDTLADSFLKCFDYIVVGTGPGGATAVHSIPNDKSVLIIERGGYSRTPHELHHTLAHVRNDFMSAGQEVILAKKLPQFAQGSVLGGGSEVNSGLYHKLPIGKKKLYLSTLDVNEITWDESEKFVEQLLKVQKTDVNIQNSLLFRGARALDLEFKNVPRWREYKEDGSYVHYGMFEIFWKDFIKRPSVTLLLGATVSRIKNFESKVQLSITDSNGKTTTVYGRKIILACGAIGTPFLLAKSGLIDWRDTRFQWHPMYRSIVKTQTEDLGFGDIDPVQAWTKDFSLKFGSAVSTPGLLSLGLGRTISINESRNLRSYYVSFSSTGRGGLVPGSKVPWYFMSEEDKHLANVGKIKLKELIIAGGGEFLNPKNPVFTKPSTVHIFGTLPAGSKIYLPGTCSLALNPNIQICDGSLLPFGPGVNPQGVIMTTVRSLFKP